MPTPAPTPPRPLVCIHGYSDSGSAFDVWKEKLAGVTPPITDIRIGSYMTLTNEVTIKDVARAMDRALEANGITRDSEFDAIVHSTGMLVIRSWLVTYPHQRECLRHLIALAPATNGSPLAHKGRSVLGAIFKGNRHIGPDFLEVGDEILDALELGSRFTWELAMQDLFGPVQYYGEGGRTPYVFIFCGNEAYRGLRKLVDEPGTDGTVRWAGCSLNSRRIELDLTRPPGPERATIGDWHRVSNVPLIFCDGLNHGTITREPSDELVSLVVEALRVETADDLTRWAADAERASVAPERRWQQFVVRVRDERGDPVHDYSLTLHVERDDDGDGHELLTAFEADVHAYQRDPSFRSFHVPLDGLLHANENGNENGHRPVTSLRLELSASTGTSLVSYRGVSDPGMNGTHPAEPNEVWVDLTPFLYTRDSRNDAFSLFYPFTTTFIDVRVERRPAPNVYTFSPSES